MPKCEVCSPVNLLFIFRTPFYKNTSEGLPLSMNECIYQIIDKNNLPLLDIETKMLLVFYHNISPR